MTIYTHTGLSAPTNATVAEFRKWASLVDAMILACGWVQTADTGQSDPATATVPGTNATAAGFRVYALDDAFAGAAPVLLKYEWGRGGGATAPTAWFTIGRESDGAGNLAGLFLARSQTTTSRTVGSTEYSSWASGDGSSLNLTMWPQSPQLTTWTLRIERSRTGGGEPTVGGLAVTLASQQTKITRTIAYTGTIDAVGDARSAAQTVALPQVVNGITNATSTPGSLSQDGATAPVFPVMHAAPGVPPWVSANLIVVAGGDASASSMIVANPHGVDRTYRAYPLVGGVAGADVVQAGTTVPSAITAQVWAEV